MILSIDFGGSTTDAVYWDKGKILSLRTFESKDMNSSRLDFSGVDRIFVTGGKSGFMKECFSGISVMKVGEIEAIGCGGRYMADDDEFLIVSMGTGTCMVRVGSGVTVKHVGGTGVGGGTFVGLGKELLGISSIDELLTVGAKGASENVDISVREIVGSGIGRISPDATASNLGKLSSEINFKKEDIAAGIINLIGQTIGVSVAFAAQAEKVSKVILAGKLTKASAISDIVCGIVRSYGMKVFIPENASYVSAIGAKVASDYGLV